MKSKVTIRKWNGNDAYSWAIFRSDRHFPVLTGLCKDDAQYYKKKEEEIIEGKKIVKTE